MDNLFPGDLKINVITPKYFSLKSYPSIITIITIIIIIASVSDLTVSETFGDKSKSRRRAAGLCNTQGQNQLSQNTL